MKLRLMTAVALAGLVLGSARASLAVTPIPIPKTRSLSPFGTTVQGARDSVAVTPIPIPKQQPTVRTSIS